MISLIFAMDQNRVIGYQNKMPWHLPEELKYFARTTKGHPVIMGRKTYDSIGKPLKGRLNIVISRNPDLIIEGCVVVNSVEEAVRPYIDSEEEAFVIGGAKMLEDALPYATRMYLTHIDHAFEGDTFFPAMDMSKWVIKRSEQGIQNEQNPFHYTMVIYELKNN